MSQDYWKKKLENFCSPTPITVGRNITGSQINQLVLDISLHPEVSEELINLSSKTSRSSVQSVFCGVIGILLNKYSAEEDVLFGVSGLQFLSQPEKIVPVPLNANSEKMLSTFLQRIQEETEQVHDNLLLSYNNYHELSSIPESEPMIEVLLVMNQKDKTRYKNFPLVFYIDTKTNCQLSIGYAEKRFTEQTIRKMGGHFEVILNALVSPNELKIKDICVLNDQEKELILKQWNKTSIDFPSDKCLHQLFEQQVIQSPEAVAVIFEEQSIDYCELNKLANQLAHYLIAKGATRGKLVGLALNRSINMVIGMLAISKSGAAYVPLDPKYPSDRLSFMLEDTGASIVLTESSLENDFPKHNARIVLIDKDRNEIESFSTKNPEVFVTSTDLAYIIYTSGSTGQPKGAVLNHQGRVNNFCDFNRRYNIGGGDKLLALASISFDMSVYDVFGTLMCGACLVVADSTNPQGAENWSRLMVKHSITVWHSVPALMEMLVDQVEQKEQLCPHDLRLVLLGGDWIPVALPDRLKRLIPNIHVVSMGGATECSMDSTIYDITEKSSDWKSIPYGFPMANQKTYVLDPHLLPVPVGVAGELHLGGIGVGEGYLNRETLTKEKFIKNPFEAGERIYKTGDLARFTEDGNLELLGRIDFQVKIRGFRVELGEIESTLRKHGAVKECVVLAKPDVNQNKRLVAYVLPDENYQDDDVEETEGEQVEQWQAVYDSAYSNAHQLEDETFNIVSWDSSYTSEPYSEEVMRIWVNSTVDRIKQHNPKTVLEIGCGTGLLLLRVAPDCDKYTGTDISQVALDHVANQKQKLNLPQIELLNCSGEDFSKIDFKSYDAVVLNSIVMDFPNINYLTEVIDGATKQIRAGGVFFVGDVRDQNSLEAFHTSVQLHRARSSASVDELKQTISRQMAIEEEMLIDPRYFILLKEQIESIQDVSILLKRGTDNNEMSKFRYDVTLYIGDAEVETINDWRTWNSEKTNFEFISNLVSEMTDRPVGINQIPNQRNAKDYSAIRLLQDDSNQFGSISDLRKAIKESVEKHVSVDPESLWALAEKLDVEVEIHYSQLNDGQFFDAVFKPKGFTKYISTLINPNALEQETDQLNSKIQKCANNPLQAKIRRKVISKLRRYLDNRLPSYMIPSAFIIMDKFPLSPNGKLNRKALPVPDNLRPELEESYQAPNNDVELVLSEIWSQCLNIDQVGIRDGFIALGGNSLTATQVVSRIRDLFQLELSISYGFNSSVEELALQLELEGNQQDVDINETASAYLRMSDLSEAELNEMLNQAG